MCADGFHNKVTLCYGEYWHDIGHFAFYCYVSIGFCLVVNRFSWDSHWSEIRCSLRKFTWLGGYEHWPSRDIKIVNPGLAQKMVNSGLAEVYS